MNYICPVCGFGGLSEPPENFVICPSCGTEFGYTDFMRTHDELRRRWIDGGLKWHSRVIPEPPNWERRKYAQLKNIGIDIQVNIGIPDERESEVTVVKYVELAGVVYTASRATAVNLTTRLFRSIGELAGVVTPSHN